MNIRIPKKLSSCPIIDAIVEIRFVPNVDKSVVFPLVYGEIKELFPGRIVNLPILQLPEQIRNNDTNLMFKPLYRLENKDIIFQMGSDVICFGSKLPYIGWQNMSLILRDIIGRIEKAKIVNRIIRLGLRYINFFDSDIFPDLDVSIGDISGYQSISKQIRFDVKDGNFINAIQFSNSARYQQPQGSIINGSLIDIDTSREYDKENMILLNLYQELEKAHDCEKKLFFHILSERFIKTLNPEY